VDPQPIVDFPVAAIPLKNLVIVYPFVVTNSYWCWIYKGYSCALAQTTSLHKKNEWQKI